MTHRQKQFVNEYLGNGMNATQAALSAGYSKKTAYSQGQRLLKHVEVKSEVEKTQARLLKNSNVKVEDLVNILKEITDNEMVTRPTAAIKAIEVMCKILGLNPTEKQEITYQYQPLFGPDKDDEDDGED
jgi:phage terminase small subunit